MLKLFIRLSLIFHTFLFVSITGASSWTTTEISKINTFSYNNLQPITDPSNKYLSSVRAKELGKQLYSDSRLSSNKKISCATCHIKEKSFTDNNNLAVGLQKGFRNTPTLLNTAHHYPKIKAPKHTFSWQTAHTQTVL